MAALPDRRLDGAPPGEAVGGDDAPFLEVAAAGGAVCLVTGDLAHFPVAARRGVEVRTPAAFVASMREGPPPR